VVTSASLQDPKSGMTATVTEGGVKITTNTGTYTGQFINGTPSAKLEGSGALSPFTFNVTGQSSGNLLQGTFEFHGTPDEAEAYMSSNGGRAMLWTQSTLFIPMLSISGSPTRRIRRGPQSTFCCPLVAKRHWGQVAVSAWNIDHRRQAATFM